MDERELERQLVLRLHRSRIAARRFARNRGSPYTGLPGTGEGPPLFGIRPEPGGKPPGMDSSHAAELQVLLEGVPLPAKKQELLEYAAHEHARPALLDALRTLRPRLYDTLDEVGEALAPVQPDRAHRDAEAPRPSSGAAPGGDDYTTPYPESGAVRDRDAL